MAASQSSEVVLVVRGVETVVWRVRQPPAADLSIVDGLARMQLVCRRQGWSIELRHPCGAVVELVDLAGLAEVLGIDLDGREGGLPA